MSGEVAVHCLCFMPASESHSLSLAYSSSSRVSVMDPLQFLVFLFVLLLSGTEATLRTSLDPSLKICIFLGWGGG
jgi:hypothetical protein